MPANGFAQLLSLPLLSDEERARMHALMRRDGWTLEALQVPSAQAPLRWFREAIPDLTAERASYLGFAAGEQARLTSYQVLTLPLVSASDLHEVLQLLNFLPLLSNALRTSWVEGEDWLMVPLWVDTGDAILDRIPVLYCASALLHLLDLLLESPSPLTVNLAWSMPSALADHPAVTSQRLCFESSFNGITLPRTALTLPCKFADPEAYRAAVIALSAQLQETMITRPVVTQVNEFLAASGGLLSLPEAAALMHMSVSTLKRRLADADTTYRTLQMDCLRDRAVGLLTNASQSLEEIAAALGYSDLSNFAHAFKRWTGQSLGAFRRAWSRV